MSVKRGNAYIMINRYQEHQGLFNSDEMATNGAIRRTPFKAMPRWFAQTFGFRISVLFLVRVISPVQNSGCKSSPDVPSLHL